MYKYRIYKHSLLVENDSDSTLKGTKRNVRVKKKIHSKMVIEVTTCTLATSSIPSVASLSGAVVRATSVSTVCIHITHMASIAALIDI